MFLDNPASTNFRDDHGAVEVYADAGAVCRLCFPCCCPTCFKPVVVDGARQRKVDLTQAQGRGGAPPLPPAGGSGGGGGGSGGGGMVVVSPQPTADTQGAQGVHGGGSGSGSGSGSAAGGGATGSGAAPVVATVRVVGSS